MGQVRGKGRPRLLLEPVSVRVDVEATARDQALALLGTMGHESFSEALRAALDFYIKHHDTKNT